ncbi:hypothetical protein SprV_0200748500 [Sparganum proliferum]
MVLPIRRTLEVNMYFWEKPICIEEVNAVSSLDSSSSFQSDTGVQSNGSQSDDKPAYDGPRDPTFSPFSNWQAYEDSTDLEVISSAMESEQKECIYNPGSSRPEQRKALTARKLARYKVDIAALRETRFSEQSQLKVAGAGHTFF